MSHDIAAIVEGTRLAAQPSGPEAGGNDRARLERIAQEFESMLLVQVLRGMRTAGSWADEEDGDTLGAESMYETLDVELATHLARIQGFGLANQLLTAFDRMNTTGASTSTPEAFTSTAVAGVTHASPLPDESSATVVDAGALAADIQGHDARGLRAPDNPVSGAVTSAFGWRRDPFTGAAAFHRGIDLRAAYGEDVQAAGEGRVIFSGQHGGYGTTVLIEHGDGTRTRYAHLSVALVGQGDVVVPGQAIGRAGRSGRATGTHVHFEVIGANGQHVDPGMAMARHVGQVSGD